MSNNTALSHSVYSSGTDDSGKLFYLTEGAIDIFVQRRSDGHDLDGPKDHIGRIETGMIFPSLNIDGISVSFLPGTICHEFLVSADNAIDTLTNSLGSIDDAVHRFVDLFVRNIYNSSDDYISLDIDQPVSVPAGSRMSAALKPCWARISQGTADWLGDADEPFTHADGFFPISPAIWLVATTELDIEYADTRELLLGDRLSTILSSYLRRAANRALRFAAYEERLEREKFLKRIADTSAEVERSLLNLSAVLSDSKDVDTPGQDSLNAAFRIVAHAQGITVRDVDVPSQTISNPFSQAKRIARINNIYIRELELNTDWWKYHTGNLLALNAEGDRWIAIIVHANGRAYIHDPEKREVRLLTASDAQCLQPRALSLSRPFSSKKIQPLELLKFSFHGLSADLSWVLLLSLCVGVIGTLLPILNGIVFDKVVPSGEENQMWVVAGLLVAAALSSALLSLSRAVALLRLEAGMDLVVQGAVWHRLLQLPVTFFRNYSAGDLADRVNAINTIRSVLSGTAMVSILSGIFSLVNLALLFYYSVPLALVALAISIISIGMILFIGSRKLKYDRLSADENGRLNGRMFEFLSGMNKLRATASEARAFYVWSMGFASLQTFQFKSGLVGILDDLFFAIWQPIVIGTIFALVAYFIVSSSAHGLSVGEFIAFNAAFGSFFAGMIGFANTALSLLQIVPLYQRAKPIMETLPEDAGYKEIIEDPSGLIEVVHLTFRYPGGPVVLKDISLAIKPSSFIAIVGPSGSGKSTLLRLLMGFEVPTSGTVSYDGRDLRRINIGELRRNIGIVLQDGKLFSADILSNIAGSEALSLEEAWTAAAMVGLDEDIKNMPMGMHTMIGEGASVLSGGQRQRIMIARAIARRPRILFLDEATSALDNSTQKIISKSLKRLKATRVVIAHRLSTVVEADEIIVIDNGQIVERGTFDVLRENGGMFQKLVERQLV